MNETWMWNVGKGNEKQRMVALIYCALEHPNPVTEYVCREILANKLLRKQNEDSTEN